MAQGWFFNRVRAADIGDRNHLIERLVRIVESAFRTIRTEETECA